MKMPDGFGAITPYLFVDKASEYVDFLKAAFNAEELSRTMRGERVTNACLSINEARLFISDVTDDYPAMTTSIYLYVEDADTSIAQAVSAGGQCEMQATDEPWGDRTGGIRDQWGNIWWISQHLGLG
ncbi:VOC family protein [Kangiella sp. TOML190]|uniref:VOC family protein n=1 Tax=Kangiella sp. TOML190 TaxID=2931351 RepID=UPI00203BDE58|nr:VOC family protein [Kangiella sp. TOML190]